MDENPSVTSSWQDQMPDGGLVPPDAQDDEFTKFLDFDFDFSALEGAVNQPDHALPASASQIPATTMMQDVQLTHPAQPLHSDYAPGGQMPAMGMPGNEVPQPLKSNFYPQKQQSMAPQNYGQRQAFIPPTPNSMEMQGRPAGYAVQVDTENQRGYEPYTRSIDDQSAFTPLISPAMTPLEQQYRLPEYTIPGEYFTPLTSPALEGHNSNSNIPHNGFPFSNGDLSFASSPMEMPSHLSNPVGPPSPGLIRKNRRKQSSQSRTTSKLVRQSPSVRPLSSRQKPKAAPGSQSEETCNSLNNQVRENKVAGYGNHLSSNESSGLDSVSPEPLNEPLMPPPALPRPSKSPYINAQESNSDQKSAGAATPATLMRLPPQQQQGDGQESFSRNGSVAVNDVPDETMEDISLPEPASGFVRPSTSHDQTPSTSAKPTPAPDPNHPGSSSVGPSPKIGAMQSPMGPVGLKRSDSKQSGKTSKKRQGPPSTQVSPALRPKMSPNLKPLIRNGTGGEGITSETPALYLASKSNYQHILEGTVLPGVSYPESLVENLNSKRTNHKLAEQGRRNRINTALKEIETLLPPALSQDKSKEKDQKNGDSTANVTGKSPAQQPISKARTVEMAIVYIKALQEELAQTQDKLKIAESGSNDKSKGAREDGKNEPDPPDKSTMGKKADDQDEAVAETTKTSA